MIDLLLILEYFGYLLIFVFILSLIGPLLGPTEFRHISYISWIFRPTRQIVLITLSAFSAWIVFFLFAPEIPSRASFIEKISQANKRLSTLESTLKAEEIDTKNLTFDVMPRSNFFRLQVRLDGKSKTKEGDATKDKIIKEVISQLDFTPETGFLSDIHNVEYDKEKLMDTLEFVGEKEEANIKALVKTIRDNETLESEVFTTTHLNLSTMQMEFEGKVFLELIYHRALEKKSLILDEKDYKKNSIDTFWSSPKLTFKQKDSSNKKTYNLEGDNEGTTFLATVDISSEFSTRDYDSSNDFYKVVMRFKKNTKDEQEKEIFEVAPALSLLHQYPVIEDLIQKGAWPFKQIKFGTGRYTASALLAESSTKDLSSGDIDKVRQKIDKKLTNLPSPTDNNLSLGRRLVGEIQLLCYFLFAYAVLLIIFSYLATVRPNNKLRSRSVHRVSGFCVDRFSDPKSQGRFWWQLRSESKPYPEDTNFDITEKHIRSPWMENNALRSTSEDYEKFYSELGRSFSDRIGLKLVKPLIPLTELRRIGYMALASSPSAENVPNFVSVEADGFYETYEAQNKIIHYLIWAIPTLGFIGTVLGIGDALSATVDIQSNVLSVRADAESQVGSNIGLAFDTTFVALFLSFFLMLFFYLLQKSQDTMISKEKRHTLSEIIQPENLVNTLSATSLQQVLVNLDKKMRQIKIDTKPTSQTPQLNSQTKPKPKNRILKFFYFLLTMGTIILLIKYFAPEELTKAIIFLTERLERLS